MRNGKWIGTCDLYHSRGEFIFVNTSTLTAFAVVQQWIGAEHLGGSERGTILTTQGTKRAVADPGHGREQHAGIQLIGADTKHRGVENSEKAVWYGTKEAGLSPCSDAASMVDGDFWLRRRIKRRFASVGLSEFNSVVNCIAARIDQF